MGSIDTAFQMIRHRLESGGWPHGSRLPSLANLAGLCTVSKTTMWHALGRLKKDGMVHTRKGGAIIAGPGGCTNPEPAKPLLLWERTRERIVRDIFTGTYVDNEYLPITKMALEYGTTFRTMRKALSALVAEGVLRGQGRRYALTRGRAHTLRQRIVFIAESESSHALTLSEPRTAAAAEGFEQAAVEMEFDGISEQFNPRNAQCLIEIKSDLSKYGTAGGYIINFWNPWNEVLVRRWLDLFFFLAGMKTCVLVLDQAGNFSFPPDLLSNPGFRVLRIAGESAGEAVGRLLYKQGYRHPAYFSPFYLNGWAQERYRGLYRVWKQAAPAVVDLFALDETADQHEFEMALLQLDGPGIRAFFKYRFSNEQTASWALKIPAVRKWELTRRLAGSPAACTIGPVAKVLAGIPDSKIDRDIFSRLQETILIKSGGKALSEYLQPLFARALRLSSADAWVASDDQTAGAATVFLRESGKRVPEDIAVVGFDNFRESREQQVSAYDFNIQGMVRRALRLIMDARSLKMQPPIGAVDGYIVERRTTRR
jgi:DNA-binding GntR family transcriptional regulator/DNA-binding LacI/PurR family transcriptional regulator